MLEKLIHLTYLLKDFIALKAEVDKLAINKLTNVPNSLINLKTKVDNLDVGKIKTFPVDLKRLSDVVDNDVIKNTKFNALKTKVNNLDEKIPDATILIHTYQYKTDQQNQRKEISDVDKRIPHTSTLVTTSVLNTNTGEVDDKIPNISNLVTTTDLNTKISKAENKIPDNSKNITTLEFNKLTAESFEVRLKQTNLLSKTYLNNKLTSFNR